MERFWPGVEPSIIMLMMAERVAMLFGTLTCTQHSPHGQSPDKQLHPMLLKRPRPWLEKFNANQPPHHCLSTQENGTWCLS